MLLLLLFKVSLIVAIKVHPHIVIDVENTFPGRRQSGGGVTGLDVNTATVHSM